jgi:hypothetical protein
MPDEIRLLSIMVRGAYDLQMLRMQAGIRLVGNFRAKLSKPHVPSNPSEPSSQSNPKPRSEPHFHRNPTRASEPDLSRNPKTKSEPIAARNPEPGSELDAEAVKMIDRLRSSYKRLTDGVARNRTLPTEKGFKGDELVSSFTELVLVDQYISIEREEAKQFRLLEVQLNKIPIYTEYLQHQKGIGPAMAGVIIGWFDPHKARHISSFWKFAGLDTGPDGRGRSRRAEHLVLREYVDRNGDPKTRNSVTYDPFLKAKLMGVLAGSFIRSGSPWRQVYDGYKHRLQSDPGRIKVELAEWKKRRTKGDDVTALWTPGRIDTASKRYMVKMFLADLWLKWRSLAGLPVTEPYAVAKLKGRPHAA